MVRLKYRYIIGQVILDPSWETDSGSDIVSNDLQNVLREKILALFGDCGYGSCGLNSFVRAFDQEKLVYIIRTPKEQVLDCVFALTCVTEVKKAHVVLRTLKVASCVRTCLKYMHDIYMEAIERDRGLSAGERAAEVDRIRSKLEKLNFS